MYALAYVLISAEFGSLQDELDRSLAPFRRGGPEDFPPEKLAFDDITPVLRGLHGAAFRFERSGENGLSASGGGEFDSYYLDLEPVRDLMKERGLATWSGRLDEVEPDFDAFAQRFSWLRGRDPATGGWGQWLNPLGRWDWWDLGGRFDGTVSGEEEGRPFPADGHTVSSGPSPGRDLVGNIGGALGTPPPDAEAETEANVEPVSALLAAARRGARHAFPHALVLPAGACPDEDRWIDGQGWRGIPAGTRAFLGLPPEAGFEAVATAAYERFQSTAAAGVAYHL